MRRSAGGERRRESGDHVSGDESKRTRSEDLHVGGGGAGAEVRSTQEGREEGVLTQHATNTEVEYDKQSSVFSNSLATLGGRCSFGIIFEPELFAGLS